MLFTLLFITFTNYILAAISDLNCTHYVENAFKYSPKATNCANKLDDKYCQTTFQAPPEVNTDADRQSKCYKDSTDTISEEVKNFVISGCPRSCAYCCLTPAYNCENKQYPRISCSLVTAAMCNHVIWKSLLAEDCPNVCGFCEEGEFPIQCFGILQWSFYT
ncbi:unnamed protein product [Cylicocyclus nassatus]|uniref:ShKT domain-containing protein n=1 Tax=Cylicocyclus nassatus TaxID=53992 RepID=A0AA36H2M1_CYLNA|nr:unnamed protein product [Cylicocyclus nassatus]